MATEKWKSILLHRELYSEIKEIAKREGRTISGQFRVIYEDWAHYVELDRDEIKKSCGQDRKSA